MFDTDRFIKWGFWSQLILLVLVDIGSLKAFMTQPDIPWYHYVGFGIVNVVLLGMTAYMWRWLKPQKSDDRT